MKVIGFNFTKINAERKHKLESVGKIGTNIEFLDIEADSISSLKDVDILKVTFKYRIEYEPGNAELLFEGITFIQTTPEKHQAFIKAWKKKKIEDDELRIPLFNIILQQCSLKALNLEEQLGLPLHVSLPKIQKKIE